MASLTPPAWLTSTPIAHRGLHDLAAGLPENSLTAFETAAEAGYPCELDVQLTKGGELIVLHDFSLRRAAGLDRPAATLTPDERRSVRLFGTDERIPTLRQVIDHVGGRIPLQVEIKRAPGDDPGTLAEAVLAALTRKTGLGRNEAEYAVSSFDPFVVHRLRAAGAPYPVGQISGQLAGQPLPWRLAGRHMIGNILTRPDFISYELAGLPSPVVRRCRERGTPVIAWGVTCAADETRARKHADNIIFDNYRPA